MNGVARTLPIDGALLDEVLFGLRRDAPTAALRWTLGERGTAEVDTAFLRHAGGWVTTVRLWNGTGLAVAAATLTIDAAAADAVSVALEPTLPPSDAWGPDGKGLADLSRAALDEFAEELLWHASRRGVTERG